MNQNVNTSNRIILSPYSIVRILGIVALFLIAASFGGQMILYLTGVGPIHGLIPMFFLGAEQNIPTYFSSLLEVFSALLLLIITVLERKRKSPYVSKWAFLSICFFYIAVDEVVSIHEHLISPVSKLLGNEHLGIFTFAWVIPGIAVVLILGAFYLRFFFYLNVKTRLNFFIAAVLMIGGAIGLELIGGRYFDLHGSNNLTYRTLQNVEESLEIIGAIVFIWGLLEYISDNFKIIQFQFTGDRRNSESNNKV